VPGLGHCVSGRREGHYRIHERVAEPYRYLVESIRRFPNRARFAAMIERAGFARVSVRNLTGGVAAIHSGWKL
jgi:demethylmenaquinone methyltransferase/2-methoxy-6-polyprenyl-1,4-benzoquinol methylase